MADISKLNITQSTNVITYTFTMTGTNTYGSVSNVMMSTSKGDKKTYFNLEYSNLDISTVMQDENSKSYITFDFANKCYTYIKSTSDFSPLEITLTTNDPNIVADGVSTVTIGTVWANFTSSKATKSTDINWLYNSIQPNNRTIKDTQNRLSTVSVLNKMPSLLHPNNRYEDKKIGECSSSLEVEYFFNKYNHATGYDGLSLGNYITINDGVYNADWMIAGFDTYKGIGQTDSGYGMVIIPRTYIETSSQSTWQMHTNATTEGGYVGSTMNTTTLESVSTQILKMIGTHNVTLSTTLTNSTDSSKSKPNGLTGAANGYKWYNKYISLMSEYQVFGNSVFGNSLDGGCQLIKLPVFNFIKPNEYAKVNFWIRTIASSTSYSYVSSSGTCWYDNANTYKYLRPLFYVR